MNADKVWAWASLMGILVSGGLLPEALYADLQQQDNATAKNTDSPPAIIAQKKRIPAMLLADKQEGRYFTGIPLIGFDEETGFNYGASIEWFDNGPKDSPFFPFTPYRRSINVGAVASTEGAVRAFVEYDQPFIKNTPWAISGNLSYEKNNNEHYFGIGEASLAHFTFPGSNESFRKFDDYEKVRDQVINGQTWTKYDAYRKKELTLVANLEYNLMEGLLRPLAGLQISRIHAGDYTGRAIDGAIGQETRLHEEVRTSDIPGFAGGWNNLLSIGLTFDSRDFKPDPNSGLLVEVLAQASAKLWGSQFNYQQVTTGITYLHDLLPEQTRLIFAGTLVYASQFGDVPFYATPNLAVPHDELRQGLGWFKTLPGYLTNRFIGDTTAHGNVELRWSFTEFTVWKQNIRMMLVPFAGAGRIFDNIGNTTLKNWKSESGLGLRLAWNLSTVISFDFARSNEGTVFYMELGHPF